MKTIPEDIFVVSGAIQKCSTEKMKTIRSCTNNLNSILQITNTP